MHVLSNFSRPDPTTSALVERRMKHWLALQELTERTPLPRPAAAPAMGPYIAISRQAGTGGERIARRVGERLGWEVLDKELVDAVARRLHLPREALELLDETSIGSLWGALAGWIDHLTIPQEKYVHRLAAIMYAAAQRGRTVIVGRGASCLLPRAGGLSVRIVASDDFRIQRVQVAQGLSPADAKRFVEQTDRNRSEFVRHYYRRDVADDRLYDLIVRVDRLGEAEAVEQIVAAAHEKLTPGAAAQTRPC